MVGHDIRNPLQAIVGDVYLAKSELASINENKHTKSVQENLDEIQKNVEYINKIVADLQDFSMRLKPNIEEADLKLIIDELMTKTYGMPENIEVSFKVESEARKAVVDSTYINRIMYNLVNNAIQAMPNGGQLENKCLQRRNRCPSLKSETQVLAFLKRSRTNCSRQCLPLNLKGKVSV